MSRLIFIFSLFAFSFAGHAATGQLSLQGTVSPQCDISSVVNGVLTVNNTGTVLAPTTDGSAVLTATGSVNVVPGAVVLTKDGADYSSNAAVLANLTLTGTGGPISPTNAGVYEITSAGAYNFVTAATVTANSGTLPVGVYAVSIPFSCAAP